MYGYIFYYVLLWLLISIYGVTCLINPCSDMIEEEWFSIIAGVVIIICIGSVLFPLLYFTNKKLLQVLKVRKTYYFSFVTAFFILGILLKYYFKINGIELF